MKNNIKNNKTGQEYYIKNPEHFVSKNKGLFTLIKPKETVLSTEIVEKEKEVKKQTKK